MGNIFGTRHFQHAYTHCEKCTQQYYQQLNQQLVIYNVYKNIDNDYTICMRCSNGHDICYFCEDKWDNHEDIWDRVVFIVNYIRSHSTYYANKQPIQSSSNINQLLQ